MAIGGKTLGIVSGLAVGIVSGVMLAALNPIVPKTGDPVETESVDQVSELEPTQKAADPALPRLSMVEPEIEQSEEPGPTVDVTPTDEDETPAVEQETVAKVEDVETPEPEPIVESELTSEPPQTVELETLDPVTEPDTQHALVLPENADTSGIDAAPEEPSTAQSGARPNVFNTPAAAVDLAEPTLDTNSPDVAQAEPASQGTIETSTVKAPEPTTEPSVISPTETVVAALPKIEDPAAPVSVAVVTEDPEPEEKIQSNTSGTFKTTGGSIITQGSSLPKIGEDPETGLASIGSGTKSSRFKTIGDSAKITEPSTDVVGTAETAPDAGALVRNANEFPVTSEPLVSIILIDDGKIAAQLPSLQGLNLPLTIAVSLDEDDASERAAQYRDAGFEVLAMTPRNVKLSLSGGQSSTQVSELLTQYFEILPSAIGLIDRPSANLQRDQRLSRSIVKHFATTGHGLITYAGGLNGAKRVADQENVANGTVFAFVDKSGEAGQIITQQLDRAAREARKSGSALVMATASKATLGTLVSWSLSSNARAVTLAPVSASLLKI